MASVVENTRSVNALHPFLSIFTVGGALDGRRPTSCLVDRPTLIAPCTALAVIECIHAAGVSIKGANSTVAGASSIAGKPAALLLTEEMATVTMCHVYTRNMIEHTARADILVVAVDKPGLISANHVRPGATVIDVGINTVRDAGGEERNSWRAGSV